MASTKSVSALSPASIAIGAVCEPKILRRWYVDECKRFRVVEMRTRFGELEYFAYDAEDISDADVRAGKLIEPFAQGTLEAVTACIDKRS